MLCHALLASPATALAMAISRRVGLISLTLLVVLLVGLPMLACTLYDPLWTSGIGSIFDMLLVAAGIVALMGWRVPPIALVVMLVAASLSHAVTA